MENEGRRRTKSIKLNPNRKGLYTTTAGVPKGGEVIHLRDREWTPGCDDKPRVWRF